MVRPESSDHMYALLNAFVLTCHALGLIDVLALGVLLEDVIHEPVRSGVLPWFVAFESLILYLRLLESEASNGVYNASNVVHRSGGIDSVRAQARVVAEALYPAAFFRTHGGNPSGANGSQSLTKEGRGLYEGIIQGSSSISTIPCSAWNAGQQHLARNVDERGFCKFKHGICDQFVSDKGPNGRCGGNHKRIECDNPNKVNAPVKA